MGAQKFNVAPKMPRMGILSCKFYIFGRQFLTSRNFFDMLNFSLAPSVMRLL